MEHWKTRFVSKLVSPEEAVSRVKNGDRIYLGSTYSEPKTMIRALRFAPVGDAELVQFLSGPEAASLASDDSHRFSLKTFYVDSMRRSMHRGSEADYVPLFHSQIPDFFRKRRIPVDVAMVQVSLPDRLGRFSLGISIDVSLAAVQSARMVIAQVNPRMPRTLGDTFIPADRINYLVDAEEELSELPEEPRGWRELAINKYCAELIEDGSVLQFGFSDISRELMSHLQGLRNLGLHTEIFTDPLIDLIESGVIDNSTKRIYRGISLATCCMGTRRLYDYVDDNSLVEFYPSDVVLNPRFIASNDKMVAINMAIQVDLRGQIRQGGPTPTAFFGSGGDHDFMRGANLSKQGRSIVCLLSTSERTGRSNIVPSFGSKAAVMMNRGDANYLITEYGIAYLGGKSVRERAMALIEVAHPEHRESLLKKAHEMGYVHRNQFYFRMASPELITRVTTDRVFKDGLQAHVRPIKPTDGPMIKDLFYNLSDSSVYFRYFTSRKIMPHENVQNYVNISDDDGLSIVVTLGPWEDCRIIAEARYLTDQANEFADVSFMVDEDFHGRGLATFLIDYMMEIAAERGVKGFAADVLRDNTPMLHLFDKVPYVLHRETSCDVVSLKFRFDELKQKPKDGV
jgi:acyl-CoA hydrolase/GNAT superfamily N-acetyltransferase